MKIKKSKLIRKIHRYLGLFLGIQFLMWTVSGLYFSWTDLDEIHGDHLRRVQPLETEFTDLISPFPYIKEQVRTVSLQEIKGEPYFWVNKKQLVHAKTGALKNEITEEEALSIAARYVKDDLIVKDIEKITEVGKHHEYRRKALPAYSISYEGSDAVKVYIGANSGSFNTIRHRDWRIFDFLWMTHTMDFEGRDDMNNLALRIFSLLGVLTVMSGFVLWYISSSTVRKVRKKAVD